MECATEAAAGRVEVYKERNCSMRYIAWFSCGAASAVAAKKALERHPGQTTIVYCDTSASEHPDNVRFLAECEGWFGQKVVVLRSEKFTSVDDVFEQTRYMSGVAGARCTAEMKKLPRYAFQRPDDVHIFGFTADEQKRVATFEANNFELNLEWLLVEDGTTKQDCYRELLNAGIALPEMYLMGYRNNNCLGCVKATSPKYWAKIREDFPEIFERRARQSREIGCRLTRIKGKRIFLDELPDEDFGRYKLENISCGPECYGGG